MKTILHPESPLADRVARSIADGTAADLLASLRQRQDELKQEVGIAQKGQQTAQDRMIDVSSRIAVETHPVNRASLQKSLAEARADFIEATASLSGLEEEVSTLDRPLAELREASERQRFTVFAEEESTPLLREVQERLADLRARMRQEMDTIKALTQRLSAAYAGWNEHASIMRFPQTDIAVIGAAPVVQALEGLVLQVPHLAVQPTVWIRLADNAAYKNVKGGAIKVSADEARDLTSQRDGEWRFARYCDPHEVEALEARQAA